MSVDKPHELVFLGGPPGVGKSTLAEKFCEEDPTSQQIGAGDLIRSIRAGERASVYAEAVQEAIAKKELVSPKVFSGLLHERLRQTNEGISLSLIDGFPYSEDDWSFFVEQMRGTALRLTGLIALNASVEQCVDRMAARGIRDGERVRLGVDEDYREFYLRRYDEYIRKRELIRGIFLRSGVPVIDIDASTDAVDVASRFKITLGLMRGGIGA